MLSLRGGALGLQATLAPQPHERPSAQRDGSVGGRAGPRGSPGRPPRALGGRRRPGRRSASYCSLHGPPQAGSRMRDDPAPPRSAKPARSRPAATSARTMLPRAALSARRAQSHARTHLHHAAEFLTGRPPRRQRGRHRDVRGTLAPVLATCHPPRRCSRSQRRGPPGEGPAVAVGVRHLRR